MIKIVSKYEETLAENLRLKQENSTLRDEVNNLKKDKQISKLKKLLLVVFPVVITIAACVLGYGFIFFFDIFMVQTFIPFFRYIQFGMILTALFSIIYFINVFARIILR